MEDTLSNLEGLLNDPVDSPFWSDDLLSSSDFGEFVGQAEVWGKAQKCKEHKCDARAWANVDQVCVLKPLSLCKAACYLPCLRRSCCPAPKCPCPKRKNDCDGWESEPDCTGKGSVKPDKCKNGTDALLVASKAQLEAYNVTDAEDIFTLAFKFCFHVKSKPYVSFGLDGRLACKSIFGTALAGCDKQPSLQDAAWILLQKLPDPLKRWQTEYVSVSPGFELGSSGSVHKCPAAFCLPFSGKGVLILKPSLLSKILQACVESLTQDLQQSVSFEELLKCYKEAVCSLLPVELLLTSTVIE